MRNYFEMRKLAIRMNNIVKGFIRTITGVPPVTLTDCVDSRSVKNYQIYGNSVQVRLPLDYQEVEYIESTGTQYIDTGYKPNQDTTVKVDFQFTDVSSDVSLFGVTGVNASSTVGRYGVDITNTVMGTLYRVYYGSNIQYDYDNVASSGKRQIIYSEIQDEYVRFYLTEGYRMSNHYYSDGLQSIYNFEIFASYHETEGTGYNPCSAKLYSFKIYESGELARDFVPCYCKADNVIGLYDLVEDKFYTNQGTGTFLKGADYTVEISPSNPVSVMSVGEYDEETGKYKIPVTASGKNLFDINNINNWVSGQYSYYSIFVGANKTVSISWDNDLSAGQGFYLCVGDKKSEKGNGSVNTPARWLYGVSASMRHNSIKVTADSEGYIYINMNPLNLNKLAKLQVEYGTTTTEFEPYVEPIKTNIYLNEPLRAIGEYRDYIDFESREAIRNITKVSNFLTKTNIVVSKKQNTTILLGANGARTIAQTLVYCPIFTGVYPTSNWTSSKENIKSHMTKGTNNYAYYNIKYDRLGLVKENDIIYKVEDETKTALTNAQICALAREYFSSNFTEEECSIYVCDYKAPTEEKIILPTLPTFKGKSVTYTIDTELQPTEMSVTYYSNTKGE